jgi:hypothetical protein
MLEITLLLIEFTEIFRNEISHVQYTTKNAVMRSKIYWTF